MSMVGLVISRLELLKLALTEMVSGQTMQMPSDGSPPRLIRGEELFSRLNGYDWPLTALTMVGVERLNSLQRMVEDVLVRGVPGDLIECGVWRGGASMLMRAVLDELGATDRRVVLADTFCGFREDEWLGQFEILKAPLEDVREAFDRLGLLPGSEFVEGRVEETLPALAGRQWAIIRLDTDTYDSIMVSLENLYPDLTSGGWVIVDDYRIINDVMSAVEDFRRRIDCPNELELLDWNCARWQKP